MLKRYLAAQWEIARIGESERILWVPVEYEMREKGSRIEKRIWREMEARERQRGR